MHHLDSLTSFRCLVLRTALTVAIALPAAHAATAAELTARPLPQNARFTTAHGHASGAFGAFEKLRSHTVRQAARKTHFSFPYGLAADALGNVYVTNYNTNTLALIKPTFLVTTNVITQGVTSPVSVAVDPLGQVFVGNTAGGGNGNVTKYANGQLVQTITANAGYPFSIAVDAFDDLFVAGSGGIAADDAYGNSLFAPEYGGYNIVSVAAGNTNVYAFNNGNYLVGNGSLLLRTDGLQAIVGPTSSQSPNGVACGAGFCWYSDADSETLTANNGVNTYSTSLQYIPAGVAFDAVHNRLFVADPLGNAVHVYNAKTLAFVKTIT